MKKITATDMGKAILLQFFLFIALASSACDADDFVFKDFEQRCLKISELVRELQLSYRMNLPGLAKSRRMLLNEWIDFFLDHGQSPPAGFNHIATSTWRTTVEQAGKTIGALTYEKITPEAADSATIPFELLAQPIKFSQVREIMASWSQVISLEKSESIASESIWIGRNVQNLVRLTGLAASSCPFEKDRVKSLIKGLDNDWRFVLEAEPELAETLFQFSSQEIRAKLKKEFEHWRKLSFM